MASKGSSLWMPLAKRSQSHPLEFLFCPLELSKGSKRKEKRAKGNSCFPDEDDNRAEEASEWLGEPCSESFMTTELEE